MNEHLLRLRHLFRIGGPLCDEKRNQQRYMEFMSERTEEEAARITRFADFLSSLQKLYPDLGVASLIVGSTTKAVDQRRHNPRDIDIRVLSGYPTDTDERKEGIQLLRNAVREYLDDGEVEFDESGSTTRTYWVKAQAFNMETNTSREIESPFTDWYNSDPSFITKNHPGIPLHISISGSNNPPTDRYMIKELRHQTSSIVLTLPVTK